MVKQKRKFSSAQIIILGFALVILLGSLFLMLPIATQDHEGATFADALFTSTSAVCVTGLVVRDTATYWTSFGHAVILILIQIGGMGVITVAASIAILSGRRINLKQRSTMQEAISAPKVGGIVRLTGFIIRTTILVELLGAVCLSFVFCKEFGFWKGVWYGFFHSISAFCNAGFDLMGVREQYSSLVYYVQNPVINFTIMGLIVFGGIGFSTWDDIFTHKFRLSRYRMQSKIILVTTAFLILIPALYFFFYQFTDGSLKERIFGSLFQSVTPRTAGFNTMDLTKLSGNSVALMIVLMIIGGSPGSTAGGMKTTTFAVIFSTSIAVFRRQEHAHFFGRRVGHETVRSAVAILFMYLVLFFVGALIISQVDNLPLSACLFETASAIGTVGLTLGITPGLSLVSRGILILLMYFGRVGGLTLIYAALTGSAGNTSRLPQEKLTVG